MTKIPIVDQSEGTVVGTTQFLVLLQSVPHLGEKALIRLLSGTAQRRISPEAVLSLSANELETELELDPRSASYIESHREELKAHSAAVARMLRSYPLQVISIAGAAYPARIERYSDIPPPVLYTLGNLKLLEPSQAQHAAAAGSSSRQIPEFTSTSTFTFTVAASRSASQASMTYLDEVSTQLASLGGVTVTGHDRPEYQRLALAAQRRNLPTVYVFDRGIREALGPEFNRPPFAAARIRDAEFVTERDLAISQFRLDDHCLGGNNRRRDSLVFTLSDLVVALDVRASGGMYEECIRAHRQGKPVFVARGGRDGNEKLRELKLPDLPDIAELVSNIEDMLVRPV